MTNLDLVRRFMLVQSNTLAWTLDAGVSGLTSTEVTPPWVYELDCATGMSAEKIAEYARLAAQGKTETRTYFGAALASSLMRKFGTRWGAGFDLMLNGYYVSDCDSSLGLYINPSLFVAYSF